MKKRLACAQYTFIVIVIGGGLIFLGTSIPGAQLWIGVVVVIAASANLAILVVDWFYDRGAKNALDEENAPR